MVKQVEQRFAERDNITNQLSAQRDFASPQRRDQRSTSDLPAGAHQSRPVNSYTTYGDDHKQRGEEFRSKYDFNPQRSPERSSRRLESPKRVTRDNFVRQDSFNEIQDERNAKTAWRPRAHPDQFSGNTGGVKVNDNREVLLRALQTVVRNTDSPSNVHYEGSRDEAHLQQKMQERSYPNYGYQEPTLSPSRSLNFKDGAPVSKFNNTSKSPTKRATNK